MPLPLGSYLPSLLAMPSASPQVRSGTVAGASGGPFPSLTSYGFAENFTLLASLSLASSPSILEVRANLLWWGRQMGNNCPFLPRNPVWCCSPESPLITHQSRLHQQRRWIAAHLTTLLFRSIWTLGTDYEQSSKWLHHCHNRRKTSKNTLTSFTISPYIHSILIHFISPFLPQSRWCPRPVRRNQPSDPVSLFCPTWAFFFNLSSSSVPLSFHLRKECHFWSWWASFSTFSPFLSWAAPRPCPRPMLSLW